MEIKNSGLSTFNDQKKSKENEMTKFAKREKNYSDLQKELYINESKKEQKEETINKAKDSLGFDPTKVTSSEITMNISIQFSMSISSNFSTKDKTLNINSMLKKAQEVLDSFDIKKTGYTGKDIKSMDEKELKELVSESGFFGIDKTAERIVDFIKNGAKGDKKKFEEGMKGLERGFKDAEAMWGGKLPDISYRTWNKTAKSLNIDFENMGEKAFLNTYDLPKPNKNDKTEEDLSNNLKEKIEELKNITSSNKQNSINQIFNTLA